MCARAVYQTRLHWWTRMDSPKKHTYIIVCSTSYVMLLLAVTAVDCFLKTNSPISYLFAALFRKKWMSLPGGAYTFIKVINFPSMFPLTKINLPPLSPISSTFSRFNLLEMRIVAPLLCPDLYEEKNRLVKPILFSFHVLCHSDEFPVNIPHGLVPSSFELEFYYIWLDLTTHWH